MKTNEEFLAAIKYRIEDDTVAPGAACETCVSCKCVDDDGTHELCNEPSFNSYRCDSCNSDLGGDRHPAHIIYANGDTNCIEICTDCLLYFANGQLPFDDN